MAITTITPRSDTLRTVQCHENSKQDAHGPTTLPYGLSIPGSGELTGLLTSSRALSIVVMLSKEGDEV